MIKQLIPIKSINWTIDKNYKEIIYSVLIGASNFAVIEQLDFWLNDDNWFK